MASLSGLTLIAVLAVVGESGDAAEARALAKKGEASYRAGRLEEAAKYLEQAYALDPEPVLLLNLARTLDAAGDLEAALRRYRQYLETASIPQDRALIERRIETLQLLLEERRAKERPPPEVSVPPPAPPPPPPQLEMPPPEREPVIVPWLVVGIGGAGMVTGTVFALLGAQKQSEAEDEPVQAEAARLISTAQTYGTVRTVAFLAGGAMVIGGLIWALISWASDVQ